jgi:TPR repeat protein
MRTFHVVRLTCLLLVLSLPLLSFGQTAASSPAQSAFLQDLDSARRGDREAKVRVARAYNEGRVVWRNASEAVWWFEQASDEGSIEATAWLGGLLLFGGTNPPDLPRAIALLQKAVDANNPIGLRFMGARYESGIGTPADPAKAVDFYSRAIAENDPESHGRLGRMYRGGLGVPKDPDKAFELFIAGGRLDDQWSQLNLAQMYLEGFSPHAIAPGQPASAGGPKPAKKDYEKARELLTASAAQGNRVAQYELGKMYEMGTGIGGRNYDLSFEYYKQSAMQRYVPAIIAVGKYHELGRGTAINLLHAHVAYKQAIEYSNGRFGLNELLKLDAKLSPAEIQHADEMLKAFEKASEAAFARSLK